RRPEIENHGTAAKLRELDRLAAADFAKRKRRSGTADERRFDLLWIFSETDEQNADDRRSDEQTDEEDGAVHASTGCGAPVSSPARAAEGSGAPLLVGMIDNAPPSPIRITAAQIHPTNGV